jgi:hypothetical protein
MSPAGPGSFDSGKHCYNLPVYSYPRFIRCSHYHEDYLF